MEDWNVVVTVCEAHFEEACDYLESIAHVSSTDYYNVLVMHVEETEGLLERIASDMQCVPSLHSAISRVIPLTRTFSFKAAPELEQKAGHVIRDWAPKLAEKSFYIRMHRRGLRGEVDSEKEERRLGEMAIEAVRENGSWCNVDFGDPDAVVAVETVGERGGLSLWSREELEKYPFLELD